MHFTKPAWVVHKDPSSKSENPKRLSIFSVHVHPDGSRIATGGLDAKVRIWSTKPILNPASEASGKPPKSLCTLTMHTGPVLVVRWAHSGRWLASGSDDEIVMIWDLDPSAKGRVWGSDEVNVEGWKPLKRLPGHESDVTDVAWSPGDRYLASVGLDSAVIIWCGHTLERLHKIDQHQGFVKGVCWDPVGEFLATQSDDRSVKIWRTTDWGMEAEVRKPFEDSPGSTFFRRLSWSPDGAHITASNATNNKGFVFIAAVITRNTWTSEISLVGHENTVEVAAYNPHIFLRNTSAPVATSNICSVVALGADDRSVSIWQTKSARPLIVAKEVFDRHIMDLSWSWDGLTLYAASSDGTIAVFSFNPAEMEGIAPHSVQEQYLAKFGFKPPPLPEGYSHLTASAQHDPNQMQTDFATGGEEKINVLVAKRSAKNKKRVGLNTVPSAASAGGNHAGVSVNAGGPVPAPPSKRAQLIPVQVHDHDSSSRLGGDRITSSSSVSVSTFPLPPELPYQAGGFLHNRHKYREEDWDMDASAPEVDIAPISAVDSSTSGQKGRGRGGSEEIRFGQVYTRRLGENVKRDPGVVKEIARIGSQPSGSGDWRGVGQVLPVPALVTYMSSEVDGNADEVFEASNNENKEHARVTFTSAKQIQWLDYLPSPALLIKATSAYCAVAMLDGCVNVYSHTGRRLLPTLSLGVSPSFMDGNKYSLMVVTSAGQLYSWNIKRQTTNFPPASLLPLLSPPTSSEADDAADVPRTFHSRTTLTGATLRANGAPILSFSNGVVYTYDVPLGCFTKLAEKWWAEGSDAWGGPGARVQRNAALTGSAGSTPSVVPGSGALGGLGGNTSGRGVVAYVEGCCNASITENKGRTQDAIEEKSRPQWWSEALTLGHLETRMYSAKMLDSPAEYKQALLAYSRKLADEGFRGKAEELIRELFGPVYWRPGRDDPTWTPIVLGMTKRDLLKEVLSIFARSKTLTKLAIDWQDIFKRAMNDEI